MKFKELERILEDCRRMADEQHLEPSDFEVVVSVDVDGICGKGESGNRIFGNVCDWGFTMTSSIPEFVIRAEFDQATPGLSIVKDKEE